MVSANKEMAVFCFDTLVAHYNSEDAPPPAFDEGQHGSSWSRVTVTWHFKARREGLCNPVKFVGPRSLGSMNKMTGNISILFLGPLFVTWKKVVNGAEPRLRGCIGTLEARYLINGFRDYALSSALKDRRFPPIQAKELPYLECTVSILTDYEAAAHYLDWEVGKHGIIIEFIDPDHHTRRSATYLPEVAAHEGWTKTEAIDSLIRKAGYNGQITESLRKRVQLTRYQSTLFTMSYSEYVSHVKETRGEAPFIFGATPHH